MRQALVALALSAVLLAGCTSSGSPDSSDDSFGDTPAFQDVEVTETTGAIRGVVVNEAIVPIAGALVQVTNGPNRTSDKDGAFLFNDLEPGTYFLTVSKAGYFPVQQSAEVVANDPAPPVVKVLLRTDVSAQPYVESLQWTGFLGCGFGTNSGGSPAGGASVNPCAADATACSFLSVCLMGTSNTHFFDFGVPGKVPDVAQAEMAWDGTQAFGDGLNLGWFKSGVSDFKSTTGPSPLILPTNQTQILEAHPEENLTGLLVRVFPGSGGPLTVSFEQRFDVYVNYFYGFQPREGWAFVIDGPCGSPDDCA